MPPHPLKNFKILTYQNKPKSNVYSRNNLSKILDGAYITNHHEFKLIAY